MASFRGEIDAGFGKVRRGNREPRGKDVGGAFGRKRPAKCGRGSTPFGLVVKQSADPLDERVRDFHSRRRVERAKNLIFRAMNDGSRGQSPRERSGMARGVRRKFPARTGKSRTDRVTESTK